MSDLKSCLLHSPIVVFGKNEEQEECELFERFLKSFQAREDKRVYDIQLIEEPMCKKSGKSSTTLNLLNWLEKSDRRLLIFILNLKDSDHLVMYDLLSVYDNALVIYKTRSDDKKNILFNTLLELKLIKNPYVYKDFRNVISNVAKIVKDENPTLLGDPVQLDYRENSCVIL